MTEQTEWVPLKEAAKRVGISKAKLSRMVAKGTVQTRVNPYDEREKLVNMTELAKLFSADK